MIKKNQWVRIHKIILNPDERAPQIPEDTRKCPLEMWDKGYLDEDANLGDQVCIRTITGRKEKGTLVEVNSAYHHDFGEFVPELLVIDEQVRGILFGGEDNDK